MVLSETCDRDSYAEFRFTGDIDRTGVLEAFREVHAYCVTHGFDAALVDLTETGGTLGPLDRIELARILADDWERGLALAVVVNDLQHLPERPAQLAAQNRGMRAREFTDVQSAAAWIRATLA